jgi:hypothetical protein
MVLIEKAEALARLERYRQAVENLERARRLAGQSDNPYTEARTQRALAGPEQSTLHCQSIGEAYVAARLFALLCLSC